MHNSLVCGTIQIDLLNTVKLFILDVNMLDKNVVNKHLIRIKRYVSYHQKLWCRWIWWNRVGLKNKQNKV